MNERIEARTCLHDFWHLAWAIGRYQFYRHRLVLRASTFADNIALALKDFP
jgi:hypothetical protein